MAFDKFLIGPFQSGLQKDLVKWQLPEDAFALLNNVYIFRGRIKKRFGTFYTGQDQRFSRVRINVGTTDGSGDFPLTLLPGAFPMIGGGQMFSIGTTIFTVDTSSVTRTTGPGTLFFNQVTGFFSVTGADPLTDIFYYPGQPIMGIFQYSPNSSINMPTFVCDTQFVYRFNGTSWETFGTNAPLFGTDIFKLDYFYGSNVRGVNASDVAFVLTNFRADSPMQWYFEGTDTWTAFEPKFNPAGTAAQFIVLTCKLIIYFHNRLLLLNTIENDDMGGTFTFQQRCRYSASGVSPFSSTAYIEPGFVGYGGAAFIDAATEEQIIGAQFIKNRLIVYFERSTRELVYTGNELSPFVWQIINIELGALATFSTVPFDRQVLGIGATGVHACNGSNVQRIDQKIPDDVFTIKSEDGAFERVYGIRDYINETSYWSYPDSDAVSSPQNYANKILVYNYQNNSWAIYDDSITAFGYFELPNVPASEFRRILGGNQQGYLFTIEDDKPDQEFVLQINNVTYVPGSPSANFQITAHNLTLGEWVQFQNINGIVINNDEYNFQVTEVVNVNNVVLTGFVDTITPANSTSFASGSYLGGGTLARVPEIDIRSKEWNPYLQESLRIYLAEIVFHVLKTEFGQITIEYYASTADDTPLLQASETSGSILGTGVLEMYPYPTVTFEQFQERLWHRIFFQGEGEFIQIRISWTEPSDFSDPALKITAQMYQPDITGSEFEIDGIILKTNRTGNL